MDQKWRILGHFGSYEGAETPITHQKWLKIGFFAVWTYPGVFSFLAPKFVKGVLPQKFHSECIPKN